MRKLEIATIGLLALDCFCPDRWQLDGNTPLLQGGHHQWLHYLESLG